ncbi:hypothetical protein SAMN02910298_00342 [Pseudobutyrivibrio sp. YE44]|uniref:RNase P modulator RnpM n=1 Tax=Pseudobutyrivibrio sp. YE44 TaxID=1520802 RepID=UPI00087FF130|nr:YlxR family protein [Pseudobutyrivibrio sp. YE44]SDB08537.1 hypothetical protein SAMN02910298_00342 [Pseudobutyrivibrio sp. YE44]
MKSKELPLRKCIACGQMLPKDQLFRLVKLQGQVELDLTYKAQSRGAYICRNKDCIELAQKKKSLNRAFKGVVNNEIIDKLFMELEDGR